MATSNVTTLPTITGVIEQQYLIEPLGGSKHPLAYTDRFPDALYAKGPESHLVRFLYSLLGPAGVGQLHADYLRARLVLEDHGLDLGGLEAFYGSPFRFGRILDETYDSDPSGVLSQDEWSRIRAKDASYRSRAIDFFNGVRAGNSPEGMRLVARSGLGHDVEIIENYRYLFDVHSDDPLGLGYFGRTTSTSEFVILPRRETSRSDVQQVTVTATGGSFMLGFRGAYTAAISWTMPDVNASALAVQAVLEAVPTVGVGNVRVTGGPTLVNAAVVVVPYSILFTGRLGSQPLPLLTSISNLTGTGAGIEIEEVVNGIDSSEEVVSIPARDHHALQTALDRIRPVASIPTTYHGSGSRASQPWATSAASSEAVEVLRFVTGQAGVAWPQTKPYEWIEKNIEKEGPRALVDVQRHYQGFHNVSAVISSSNHVGRFSAAQIAALPALAAATDDTQVFAADRVLADYAAPLTVTANIDNNTALIQGIYPLEYLSLAGVPDIRYHDEQFWSSADATTGQETLIIDLGTAQAVNFLSFEITRKPIAISVDYDVLDNAGDYLWFPVVPDATQPYPDTVSYTAEANPWSLTTLHFSDDQGHQVLSRYIRINFARSTSGIDPFIDGEPFSVDVRNLRIGRNVV